MSQELAKQNSMLKEYVAVLERQNNSRNIQKDVLLRQINNLNQENDELRAQISRSKLTRSSTQEIEGLLKTRQQLEIKLRQLQSGFEKISRNKIQLETENARLKTQLTNLNNRFTSLQTTTTENSKLKNDAEQLRKQSLLLSAKQTQITRLENQIKQLRDQINKSEQKHRNDLKQNQMKSFRISEVETDKLKQSIKKQLQKQNQQEMIKITTYFNDTLQKKENIIVELETKLSLLQRQSRQNQSNINEDLIKLRTAKRQLESKLQIAQRQKGIQERRLNELQSQVSQKAILLQRKQQEQQQLQNIKEVVAKKQSQILQSGSIIEALKNNVIILERKVKDLQLQIESSRERNNVNDNKKQTELRNLQGKYQREIEELKQKLQIQQKSFPSTLNEQKRIATEKQRQNLQLRKIIDELSQNNNNLLQKLKVMQQMQEVQHTSKVSPRDVRNQGDLRNVVEELRRELTTVRSEFKKIQQDNKRMENFMSARSAQVSNMNQQKSYPNVYQTFNRNLQQKDRKTPPTNQISGNLSFKSISYNQQPNVRYSKLGNGAQKLKPSSNQEIGKSMNRDKWELLQRRISQLRQENAELKQSLYP